MGYLGHVATVGAGDLANPWGISVMQVAWFQGAPYLYTGSFADGGANRLVLQSDAVAQMDQSRPASNQSGSRGFSDMAFLEVGGQTLWLAAGTQQAVRAVRNVDPDGSLRNLRAWEADAGDLGHWSAVAGFTQAGTTHVVAATYARPGLQVFRLDDATTPVLTDTPGDHRKTVLDDLTALITVHPGAVPVIVAASGARGGIATYLAQPDGTLALADTLGAAFGLGMAGVTSLASAQVAGQTFVLAGAAGTGTITAFRVNPLGVLFVTDHATDSLHTRFGGVQDIATFSHAGRAFAVAGGGDDGLALFEVGPGGRLYHLQSVAHQPGWTLENVQALAAEVVGGKAQVFAAGGVQAGITPFSVDMTRFGVSAVAAPGQALLAGTAADDHLEGAAGDVTLQGGAGNDRLVAGTGVTTMWGGPGEDVFVFRPGGGTDRIMDFRPGHDRIDLSAYPMLYSPAGIAVTATDTGARLGVQGDTIDVTTHDFMPLHPWDFGADMFVFSG